MSAAPFTQNFFGVYGRNTGVLTYLALSCIAISSLLISSMKNYELIWKGFLTTGLVNFTYCAWVILFGDFLGWNNPYKAILGLFGNPDFISAFLGMFIVGIFSYIVSPSAQRKFQFIGVMLIPMIIFEILKSHAIQGLVVTAGGFSLIVFFKIYSVTRKKTYLYGYIVFISTMGLVAILGTLQKGPLSFVYKRSVSFRGTYWEAGIEMGKSHPFTGVGMDTYGDWYRRTRPPVALIDTPGIGVTSNVAHNVVIDFFAFGGYPLLFAYLATLIFTSIAILRVIKRMKSYDYVFVGMTSVWVCYQVQSFISINQIGLAIWGWVFAGLIIGYESVTRGDTIQNPTVSKRKQVESPISPNLVVGVGIGIGLLLGFPPFNADVRWKAAATQQSVAVVEDALKPSLFNPANSQKFGMAVENLAASNLGKQAHKYATEAVRFNADNFDAWYQLYTLSISTPAEKQAALTNMKRLDPLNPDVTVR
jgi:hypothetical protein